jgi:tricorn protease
MVPRGGCTLFKKAVFIHVVQIAILFGALLLSPTAYSQTKLLRFPDIHGDRVVFTYGGDIWTASSSGGSAIRLTAHPGMEVFAKFSQDGKWITFTGTI